MVGAPMSPIRCDACKASVRHRDTGTLKVVTILAWLGTTAVAFLWLLRIDPAIAVLVALAGPGVIVEWAAVGYLRRRKVLEVVLQPAISTPKTRTDSDSENHG